MTYGTLFDYIAWRGDITFDEMEFNEVDNLIFSFLAYANFIHVPVSDEENKNGLSIKEYYDRLIKIGGFEETLSWIIKENELKIIAESKRFSNVLIKNYIDIVKQDEKDSIQFAAMDFYFKDKTHYLAFRGTDNSIAGWKEDTDLTYKKVPAQDFAVDYLSMSIKDGETYYVGGHSKGGNLAIYGCGMLSDEKLKYVKTIYDNDGPGICREVMDIRFLKRIDCKTVQINPTYSVIGQFFSIPFSNSKIVQSNERKLMQHDIKSWLVTNKELCLAKEFDSEAIAINNAIGMYISDTKLKDREAFINELFGIIDDKGKKKTVTSVTNGGLKELSRLLLQFAGRTNKMTKELTRLPFTVWFARTLMKFRHTKPIQFLFRHSSFLIGPVFLALGLIFLFVPFSFIPAVIGSSFLFITLIELVSFFYLLYLSHWNIRRNLTRLYITVILIALSIAYFVSGDKMAGFSSILFGILMMTFAFALISRIVDHFRKKDYFSFSLSLIECITMICVGLYFVIISEFDSELLPKTIGICFLILGGLRLFDGFYECILSLYREHHSK